jgi:hypothetical protein
MRGVSHVYSDMPEDGMTARCYAFEEVFGEKIRALGERSRLSQPTIRRQRSMRTSGGPVYVFRCAACDKKFERRSYDATLRPHKNRDGWDCYGRYGIYEKTKY